MFTPRKLPVQLLLFRFCLSKLLIMRAPSQPPNTSEIGSRIFPSFNIPSFFAQSSLPLKLLQFLNRLISITPINHAIFGIKSLVFRVNVEIILYFANDVIGLWLMPIVGHLNPVDKPMF